MAKRSRDRPTKPAMGSSIFSLPVHTLMEILSTLPPKTICDCRSVCSYFRKLISDPEFAKLHLPRSNPTFIVSPTVASSTYRDLCLLESIEPPIITYDSQSDVIKIPTEKTLFKFKPKPYKLDKPCCDLQVLGSCNGLICFHCPTTYNPYFICNPLLNECVIVPQIEMGLFRQVGSGFGFCPKTNQYKVLRFLFPITVNCGLQGLNDWATEIVTLGTNLWRNVGVAPRYLHWVSSGCFLKGALHWIVHNSNNSFESVCCFDFESEGFKLFKGGPCGFNEDDNGNVLFMSIGVLDDCLCIYHHSDTYKLDIWVLSDYELKKPWVLRFVVDLKWPVSRFGRLYQPLKFWNNGEILMLFGTSSLVSFNRWDRRLREVTINGIPRFFKAMEYVPSFLSVKNVAKGNTEGTTSQLC